MEFPRKRRYSGGGSCTVRDSAVDTAWCTHSWSNARATQTIRESLSGDPWAAPEAPMFGSLTVPGANSVSNRGPPGDPHL